MERQIKFRGKRVDNGEWVQGDLLQTNEGSVCIGVHGQYIDDGMHFNDMYNKTPYIDEDTIGQFTGLHDIKGDEIYEGDILDSKTSDFAPNGYSFICKWIDSGFALLYQGRTYGVKERNNWMNRYPLCQKNVEDLIIRGNVFDNPELIK